MVTFESVELLDEADDTNDTQRPCAAPGAKTTKEQRPMANPEPLCLRCSEPLGAHPHMRCDEYEPEDTAKPRAPARFLVPITNRTTHTATIVDYVVIVDERGLWVRPSRARTWRRLAWHDVPFAANPTTQKPAGTK